MNETTAGSERAWCNPEIDPGRLASVGDLAWQSLSPGYRKAVLAVSVPFWLLVVAVVLLVPVLIGAEVRPEWMDIASPFRWLVIPVALISLALGLLRIHFMRYAVRENDVNFRKGIIWRSSSHLPFSRIQHVGLDSGPVDRFFGLRQLTFFTAGSVGADLSIPGLPEDVAERLRQYIVDQAGLEDDDS